MSDNPTECPKLDKPEKKKLKPGQKKENRTFKDEKNAMRQAKTRAIKKITNAVSKLRSLDIEPVEVLVVIKDVKTNKFKIMGEGIMLENFINRKPLTTDPPTKFKKHDTESKQSATKITSDTYPFLKKKSNKIDQQQLKMLQEIRVHTEDGVEIAHSDKGNVSDIDYSLEEKDKPNQGNLLRKQNSFLGQHVLNSNDSSDKMDNAANCEIRNILDADFHLEEMKQQDTDYILSSFGSVMEYTTLNYEDSSCDIDIADNCEKGEVSDTFYSLKEKNKHQKRNLVEKHDLVLGQKIFNSNNSSDTMNIAENGEFSNILDADFSLEEMDKYKQGNSIVKHDFVWGQNIINSNNSSDEMNIVEKCEIRNILEEDFSLEEMKQIDEDSLFANFEPLKENNFLDHMDSNDYIDNADNWYSL